MDEMRMWMKYAKNEIMKVTSSFQICKALNQNDSCLFLLGKRKW